MKRLTYVVGSSLLLIFLTCVTSNASNLLYSESVKNFDTPGVEVGIELFEQGVSGVSQSPVLVLVFTPLHYEQIERFRADVSVMMSRLEVTAPFDEYKNRIASWIVYLPKEESEEIFKATDNHPYLKVRLDFLESVAAKVGRSSFKVVILDAQRRVSCAELSSITDMSLIIIGRNRYGNNESLAKGFLHELGHALGLRDESLDEQARQHCPPGPPNCATTQKDAQDWWGDLAKTKQGVGFIKGCCGNSEYLRPTIASLMNDADKTNDFGPVNERYLQKALAGILAGIKD